MRDRFWIFYSGLTYDDVGGLKFLVATNNFKMETLLPDVRPATTNSSLVKSALRPGVDKITFIRQPQDSVTGGFRLFTNHFTDTFITNGKVLHQEVQRVIPRADILFSADDNGKRSPNTISVLRTGITNWINNLGIKCGHKSIGGLASSLRLSISYFISSVLL